MRIVVRGAVWFGLYIFLILFPLMVGAVFREPGGSPSILIDLAAALGYIGLALMAFELALVSRVNGAASAFGLDALLQFHREIGIVAFLLVLAHPVVLLLSGLYPLVFVLPLPSVPWPIWMGTLALGAVALLILLSVWRKRLKIRYEVWQVTHGLLAILLLLLASVHILSVGRYAHLPAVRLVWFLYLLVFIGLLARYRILKPLQLWGKPWEVVENKAELGNAHTLRLRPVDHGGFTFEPGQFGWITMGRTPFHLEQHPISLSSNGDIPSGDGEIAFTIKSLGDWSGKVVPAVKPGAHVFVDGPYGVFSMDREQGPGYVLIGGGVGITPLHAMLLAMAEREDVRPVIVFYGANTVDDLTFRDELEGLVQQMTLKVVIVLSKPPEDWTGETGYITGDVLRRHLPKQYKRFQYFICGPTPLMDAVEKALPELGVPADKIHTERFDMV